MNESFTPSKGPKTVTSTPEELIGKVIPFSDPDLNKTTDVEISKINQILGRGGFSDWVADVEIRIVNEHIGKSKTHCMALKKYKEDESGEESVEKMIQRSYNNFKILKTIKIPTWETYRTNIEEKLVLMTLGIKEGEKLFTTNDVNGPKTKPFLEKPIRQIGNFYEFKNQIKSILKILNANKLSLNADSWGVVFTPSTKGADTYDLKPVIADLDFVNSHVIDKTTKYQIVKTEPAKLDTIGGRENEVDTETSHTIEQNLNTLFIALFFIYPGTDDEKRHFANSIIMD